MTFFICESTKRGIQAKKNLSFISIITAAVAYFPSQNIWIKLSCQLHHLHLWYPPTPSSHATITNTYYKYVPKLLCETAELVGKLVLKPPQTSTRHYQNTLRHGWKSLINSMTLPLIKSETSSGFFWVLRLQ